MLKYSFESFAYGTPLLAEEPPQEFELGATIRCWTLDGKELWIPNTYLYAESA